MTTTSGHVKSILDQSFRYTPSDQTDLRKTFAKIRRARRLQQRPQAQTDAVSPINQGPRAATTTALREI